MGEAAAAPGRRHVPLWVRIVVAVALGVAAAAVFGRRVEPLGDLGMLVIRALKALAPPLILFAVIDAFARTHIRGRQAARLLALSTMNAVVAVCIGLGIARALHLGSTWRGHLTDILHAPAPATATRQGAAPTLDPLSNVSHMLPESLVEPFARNNVIGVVLIAVALGVALRLLKSRADPEHAEALATWERLAAGGLSLFATVLHGVVQAVPFAVFGVVAKVVARTGVGVFAALAPFLLTVMLGLFMQAVVWYGLLIAVVARRSPREFFAGAADAALTALSCGSSLATLPVTLKCLHENLKVSAGNARLAACVGTNLNHDGIILYEAGAAVFIAQAMGVELTAGQQVTVALSSVMAGVGIAGVPEAGLITLPLVLGAAGIPDATVAAVVPFLLPVDWIVGRGRACTNVLSDMTVATLLDRFEERDKATEGSG